jgi:hypothetical protein
MVMIESTTIPDKICNQEYFAKFSDDLVGNYVWRGAGSAIFVEFGVLHRVLGQDGLPRLRLDGKPMTPNGDWTLMIEWSWRIEGPRAVSAGSWSSEAEINRVLRKLLHAHVVRVETFGKIPEICISLSNNKSILSFVTVKGDPVWSLMRRRTGAVEWMKIVKGKFVTGAQTYDSEFMLL